MFATTSCWSAGSTRTWRASSVIRPSLGRRSRSGRVRPSSGSRASIVGFQRLIQLRGHPRLRRSGVGRDRAGSAGRRPERNGSAPCMPSFVRMPWYGPCRPHRAEPSRAPAPHEHRTRPRGVSRTKPTPGARCPSWSPAGRRSCRGRPCRAGHDPGAARRPAQGPTGHCPPRWARAAQLCRPSNAATAVAPGRRPCSSWPGVDPAAVRCHRRRVGHTSAGLSSRALHPYTSPVGPGWLGGQLSLLRSTLYDPSTYWRLISSSP